MLVFVLLKRFYNPYAQQLDHLGMVYLNNNKTRYYTLLDIC